MFHFGVSQHVEASSWIVLVRKWSSKNPAVEVVFSWNEGQSWYDFELSSMPVEVVKPKGETSSRFMGKKRCLRLLPIFDNLLQGFPFPPGNLVYISPQIFQVPEVGCKRPRWKIWGVFSRHVIPLPWMKYDEMTSWTVTNASPARSEGGQYCD